MIVSITGVAEGIGVGVSVGSGVAVGVSVGGGVGETDSVAGLPLLGAWVVPTKGIGAEESGV